MENDIMKCSKNHVDGVWEIVGSCSEWLSGRGMNHWKDYYTRDIVADNIENAATYGFFLDKKMVGVGCLDGRVSDYYRKNYMDLCEDFSASALYLNVLGG